MQEQTCALRALTLCDGHLLEIDPLRTVSCLCWLQERAEAAELHRVASAVADERSSVLQRLDLRQV